MLPRPLTIGLTVLIAMMWSANMVVGFIAPERSNLYINGIMAIVAGAVFGLGRKQDNPRVDPPVDHRDEP